MQPEISGHPVCETCRRVIPDLPGVSPGNMARRRFCSRACWHRRTLTPAPVRFWAKVRKGDACWEWTGAMDGGYGHFRAVAGVRPVRTHRYSWELANGPVPTGLGVLHRCDNPPCVRPDHLFVGTQSDNLRDAYNRGRRVSHRR